MAATAAEVRRRRGGHYGGKDRRGEEGVVVVVMVVVSAVAVRNNGWARNGSSVRLASRREQAAEAFFRRASLACAGSLSVASCGLEPGPSSKLAVTTAPMHRRLLPASPSAIPLQYRSCYFSAAIARPDLPVISSPRRALVVARDSEHSTTPSNHPPEQPWTLECTALGTQPSPSRRSS
jgi:hypothetical protein